AKGTEASIYGARSKSDLDLLIGFLRGPRLMRMDDICGSLTLAARHRPQKVTVPMKFLITNDDGIDAAGLNALLEAAQNFGEATIVAPAAPQSGVSHAVTWHEGVRIEPRGEKRQSGSDRFAIQGTPADCIRLGLL